MHIMRKVKKNGMAALIIVSLMSIACAPNQYSIRSVESKSVALDQRWDGRANPELTTLVESYKARVDSEMNLVVGKATQTLNVGFPQSKLSNFTADMMFNIGDEIWKNVDFAIINMGGLRTSMNEGDITVRELFEIFPFENRLVLLELQASDVEELFEFIAFNGGEGLSKNLQLIVKNRKIESLKIGGKPVVKDKIYRIVTVDFLAEGKDGMVALRKAQNRFDSQEILRNMMIRYIQRLTDNNQEVNAEMDNRITIIQ